MKTSLPLALACLFLPTAPATAQEWDSWEQETDLSATVVSGFGGPGFETTMEFQLGWRATRVLSNGAELGVRVIGRAQRDHPQRPAGQGVFDTGLVLPGGAFSGIGASGNDVDESVRFGLEAAYIYLDGGYGELTFGRDQGIASRFHEGPDEAFRLARIDAPLLDPTGLGLVSTRNDISGPSIKLTYATPRILGLRAGVSVVPDAGEARGLDRDPVASALPVPSARPGSGMEAALNLSRVLGRNGPRVDVTAGWSKYDISEERGAVAGMADQVETWSAGARLEFDSLTLGASWISSDEGFLGDKKTESWTVGVSRDFGEDWSASATWGEAEYDRLGLSAESLSLAVSRQFGDHVRLTGGWRDNEAGWGVASGERARGIVVEITLSQ